MKQTKVLRIVTAGLLGFLTACAVDARVLETLPAAQAPAPGPAGTAVFDGGTTHEGAKDADAPLAPLSARTVVAGGVHTCGRRPDGGAFCWGANDSGQLGTGSALVPGAASSVATPTRVRDLRKVAELALGSDHTCARTDDGDVWCWGGNAVGEVGIPPSPTQPAAAEVTPWFIESLRGAVTQIATGRNHSCAVLRDRTARCWGANGRGELGSGSSDAWTSTPSAVKDLVGVTQLALGWSFSCALLEGGTVSCWGENGRGQLGDGTGVDRSVPAAVLGLSDVVEIALGASHACARRAEGTVVCWGENTHGQLGDGTTTRRSTPVVTLPNNGAPGVTQLALGNGHSCARRTDGTVACWGKNDFGQLGIPEATPVLRPTTVTAISEITEVTTGFTHTCALDQSGRLFCWGRGTDGQLATADFDGRPSPTLATW